MSECTRPLEPLLEANLEVLAGDDDSELAEHVRECTRCGAVAREILAATRRLEEALTRGPSASDVDAVLRRAAVAAGGRGERVARHLPPAARWVALAAAAMAALMIVGDREPAVIGVPMPPAGASFPLVEPAAEQSVAIIPTRDPDITVVWFFQGD